MIRAFCGLAFLTLLLNSAAVAETSATAALESGPVSYFENNCARCHGTMGSSYGSSFGKGLSTEALRKTVSDMAKGPGQSPLEGIELDAEVAFHKALIAHEPFIAITSVGNSTIKGEAISGSKISASANGKPVPVKADDFNWEIALTPQLKPSEIVVSSSVNDKQTSLAVGTTPFSNPTATAK